MAKKLSGIVIVSCISVLLAALSFSASASVISFELVYEKPFHQRQQYTSADLERIRRYKKQETEKALNDFFKEIRIIFVLLSCFVLIIFYPLDKYCFNGKGLYLLRHLHGREKAYFKQLKETMGTVKVDGPINQFNIGSTGDFVNLQLNYQRKDQYGIYGYEPLYPADIINMMLETKKPAFLLGELGSGKTSYLHYLASLLVAKNYESLHLQQALFPLLIHARDIIRDDCLQQEDSLARALAASIHKNNVKIWVQTYCDWLKHKTCLIMIDGVGEVGSEAEQERLYEWLNDVLIKQWANRHIVLIASRAKGFKNNRITEGFIKADVKPFATTMAACCKAGHDLS